MNFYLGDVLCDRKINFTQKNTLPKILGFKNTIFAAKTKHESDCIVDLMSLNSIRVECNIVTCDAAFWSRKKISFC